jgi:hypothetical protein
MSTVQANFLIPAELLATLRALVPRGKQSEVVTNALKNELRRIQFRKTLEESFGAWEKGTHPELQKGTEQFIRKLRASTRATRKN